MLILETSTRLTGERNRALELANQVTVYLGLGDLADKQKHQGASNLHGSNLVYINECRSWEQTVFIVGPLIQPLS